MAATTDDSNVPHATKKKYLGIPEAVFLVRKPGCLSVEILNNTAQLNTHVLHVAVFGQDVILASS